MAEDKSSILLTLFELEVLSWEFSEARNGDGKQPLKQGCDDVPPEHGGCILAREFKTLTSNFIVYA